LSLLCIPTRAQYTHLYEFTGSPNGDTPYGTLISDGTFLYGMTAFGGSNDSGMIFKILPDGSGFLKLHDFTGLPDGAWATASLVTEGTFLYGMTASGGANNLGTIFKIKTDGTGYSLHGSCKKIF
jgi:uncharacterized repeat protein (TIGR03803 family)